MVFKQRVSHTRNLTSVTIRPFALLCEERETLTQAYLDAAENSRRVSDSIKDIHSPEWSNAIKQARQLCETTLAALKLHINEHKCRMVASTSVSR